MKAHNRIILILIISLSTICNGAESRTLIQAPDESDEAFEARLLVYSNHVSYAEFRAKSAVPENLKLSLHEAFLTAQEKHLSNEIIDREEFWLNVAIFEHKADWQKPEREMIHFAFLRLAQLTHQLDKVDGYISQALSFDDTIELDHKLIPPPLVEKYKKMKRNSFKINLPPKAFKDFSLILVNGVQYVLSGQSELRVAPGRKRFSLYSNKYEPITRILDTDDVANIDFQKIAIRQTDTAMAKRQNSREAKQKTEASGAQSWNKIPKYNYNDMSQLQDPIAQNRSEKKFYEKPKFWWISAGLAASIFAAYTLLNKKDEERTPTRREGY